jgi:hypothetical protein
MIHLPFQRVNHRSHQAKTQESDFQSGALARRYTDPRSPYELALLFCMERAREYLDDIVKDTDGLTHIACEARGGSGARRIESLNLNSAELRQAQIPSVAGR